MTIVSAGFKIDTSAFEKYCRQTLEVYMQEYSWYYIPASVHKVLVHGPEIITHAILPIGKLSEEAQEARNKDLKHYRREHTRKYSRIVTNEDLLHLLLVSSDPFITSLRPPPRRTRNKLSAEVMQLLTAPDILGTSMSHDISTSSDSEELSTSDSSEAQSDYESDY